MDDSSGAPPGPAIESLAVAVVEAVAERAGVDATDLDRPLYDVIDPDALDSLYRRWLESGSADRTSITFRYLDLDVRITGGGEVSISEREGPDPDDVA